MVLSNYNWLIGQQQIQKATSSNDRLNERVECAELSKRLEILETEREMLPEIEEEG